MHKNKKRRILEVIVLFSVAILGVYITLYSLSNSIVFFHPPSEMEKIMSSSGAKIRVGGLVKSGSVKRDNDSLIFVIEDNCSELKIEYKGLVPALFREGQGVIAEGSIDVVSLVFKASSLLTKHDENYRPPEPAKKS